MGYYDLARKTLKGCGSPADQVACVAEALKQVERETWLEAAWTVEQQYGVSHWTEEDTVALLKSKAEQA